MDSGSLPLFVLKFCSFCSNEEVPVELSDRSGARPGFIGLSEIVYVIDVA